MQISLADIAKQLGLELRGDGSVLISRIAPLDKSGEGDISFMTSAKYRDQLSQCQASALILAPAVADEFAGNVLLADDPYLAYAKLAQLMDTTPACAEGIAESAVIHPSAQLGEGVSVAANAVIEANAVLGDGVQVGAGSVVGQGAKLGNGTKLWANVTIYHGVELGANCLVQSNTEIGSDGFGYANDRGRWVKIPQLGSVIIGDSVEIGASTTIDRGALDDTIIASNVIIDNQVHMAHNCQVGEGTAIAGGVQMAGSTTIGRYCILGGNVGINGHISICDQVTITGYTMVVKSITEPGTYSSGMPAMGNREWRRLTARLGKLDDMHKRLTTLEKKQVGDQDS